MRGSERSSRPPLRLDLQGEPADQSRLFDGLAAEADSPSASACRHRVTIDLRGMGERLHAFASARRMTMAGSVRRALEAMLADEGEIGDPPSVVADRAGDGPQVKVTLRLPAIHVRLLVMRARRADVSQGEYVAGLIEGAPLAPKMPDHAEVLKALCQSTSNLAALCVHLHALTRSSGRDAGGDLVPHRASLSRLEDVVGVHVRLASKLIADIKATRRLPRPSGVKRSGSQGST
jgi:hypothetical protein